MDDALVHTVLSVIVHYGGDEFKCWEEELEEKLREDCNSQNEPPPTAVNGNRRKHDHWQHPDHRGNQC